MREGYWMIRTYEAGAVGEKTKYWVPGKKPSRSDRREKTEIRKQLQNEYSVQKQLARLINANFGPGDLLLGLDYSSEGMDRLEAWAVSRGLAPYSPDETEKMEAIRQAADWALGNLLRRVKRAMDKEGLVLRYVAITSDMDGDTGEAVRVHHHLVVPKEAKAAFLSKWEGWGGVDWSSLSRQRDYTPIAEYFIRQVRKVPDWEMDSIMGCKGSKAALVVLTERLTRQPIIIRVQDHTMESVVRALDRLERCMGAKFREVFRSITVDNGCEFQDCKGMERSRRARKPRTKIYYCHPYSAYERGSNENMNRIIRRFFPKGTNFDAITAAEVAWVERWLANYPRRILGWRTPQMLFDKYVAPAA